MKLTLQDMMKIFKELLKGRFKITFPKFTIFSFHIFEHWSKRSPGPEIPCLPLFLGPSLSLCFLRLSWVVFDFIPSGLSSVWGGSPGCSVSSDSLQSSLPTDPLPSPTLRQDKTHPGFSCFSWAGLPCFPGHAFWLFWDLFSSSLWNATLLPWLLLAWSLFPSGFCGISGWSPPFCVLWSVRILYFVVSGVRGTLVLLSSGTICTWGDSGIF